MKSFLTGALVALCLALPVRAADDTPPWARDAVEQLRAAHLLEGYPGGSLNGHRAMTRYELVELLNRVEARDQEQNDDLATRQDLSDLQKSAETMRQQLDQLGGSDLERRVDELQLRVNEVNNPGL